MIVKVIVSQDVNGKTVALVRNRTSDYRWRDVPPDWLIAWMHGRQKGYFRVSDEIPLSSGLPVFLSEAGKEDQDF